MLISVRKMMTAVLGAIALGSAASPLQERQFSYAPEGSVAYRWGTGKAELYDVAIRLDDAGLVGSRITSMRMPLSTDKAISNASGWLTTELKLENKVNAPDVVQAEATIDPGNDDEYPSLRLTLPEPYTITGEGVYVGFTFTVGAVETDNQKNPLLVTYGDNPNGFYLHTPRTYLKWNNRQEDLGAVSMMEVTLEGEFLDDAVALTAVSTLYLEPGNEGKLRASLVNHGSAKVESVHYLFRAGDMDVEGTARLAEPLAAMFGSEGWVELDVKAPDATGPYEYTVTIDGVNGHSNLDSSNELAGRLNVISFVPETRPLMEEYTGLWCAWCPRGFVGLERMNAAWPGRFVGLSYHAANDGIEPLQCVREFPGRVNGFPAAIMNRSFQADPYFGLTNNVEMGIEQVWLGLASQFTVADVSARSYWTDDTHAELRADADVRFVMDAEDADFRLSYVLVGDGLHNDSWKQANAFAGYDYSGDDWKPFVEGGMFVSGLVFNDIVLSYDHQQGIEGSIPAHICRDETYTHSFTFNMADVRNIYGDNIVSDPGKLRVVAILTDGATGEFVNCCSSGYVAGSGVRGESLAPVMAERWYDLQGNLLAEPYKGVCIRVATHADGTVTSTRVMCGN